MIANCQLCGDFARLDEYHRCKKCAPVDDFLLLEVRDYVRTHGKVSIHEICDEFGIEEFRVQRWIAEDRLGYLSPTYICSHCGGEVVAGFVCPCQTERKPDYQYHGPTRTLTKRRDEYWDRISRIRKHQRREIWAARR